MVSGSDSTIRSPSNNESLRRFNPQTESDIEILLKDLPAGARNVISGFYDLPLMSKEQLIELINSHTQTLDNAADYRGDIDADLAERISRSCMALLEKQWDVEADKGRRLIQAVCMYYVETEDEDGDLQSEFGLNDDAELLNVVAAHLGREDLVVRV